MLKEERVRLCNHSSINLYEGQHVPVEKFVVVHQIGT